MMPPIGTPRFSYASLDSSLDALRRWFLTFPAPVLSRPCGSTDLAAAGERTGKAQE